MTRKLTFLILAMLFAILGPGAEAWGQTRESYTITFKVGSGDGTSASTSTACSTIVSDGSDYLSGNLATATKVYYSGDYGLKLGASSNAGTIKMNLSSDGQVTPTSIVVNAKLYNSSKATTLKVNGSATQNLTANFADYTFNITSNITYLELVTSKYAWISSITVNYEGSTATLESIEVSGSPTKTSYEAGESFDPAGLVVTGTYDDESQETITSGITWNVTPNPLTAGTTSVSVTATVSEITSAAYQVDGLTVNQHVVTPGTYEIIPNNIFFGIEVQTTGSHDPVTGTQNDVTITHSGGSNFYCNASQVRTYKDNTLTFSVPTGYEITSIVLAVTDNASYSANVGTYTVSTKTWTGSAQEIVLTSGQSSGNYQITKITVTFVAKKTLQSIAVKTPPTKTTYNVGETFDPTGLVITATYDEGDPEDIAYADNESDFSFSPTLETALTTAIENVTITYGGKSCNQDITVNLIKLETPANLEATNVTSTSATLTWNEVANASSYEVNVLGDSYDETFTPTANSLLVEGLTANTEYLWSVKAIGDNTTYANSDENSDGNFTTSAPPTVAYTVSFDGNEHGTPASESIKETEAGAGVTLPDCTPNAGYQFVGWATSETATEAEYEAVATYYPTADITLYAVYNEVYTINYMVNGVNTDAQENVLEGTPLVFPTVTAPDADHVFRGWVTEAIEGTTDTEPAYVNTTDLTATQNNTYYAVFAERSGSEPAEQKTQTLKYDTWTYYGSTTDKDTYRLFHSGSYIESAEFDLSKLTKVIVYGGSFGGASYNSLTIGDGTNTWKSVTVSGTSQTGTNTYTDGTPLSGTGKLRITSNSGTATGTGVRISKVEIFTMEGGYTYSNFCTTIETKILTSISLSGAYPTEFWKGETFSHEGIIVTAHYSNALDADVTSKATFSTPDMATAGEQTVTVTYDMKSTTYSITVKNIANTQETAYTVAEAKELIDANPAELATTEVFVAGKICKIDNYNSTYKSITYWISTDGTQDNMFEVYSGKGLSGADFESIEDIEPQADVIIYGKIKKFNSTYEFDKNNYLVSYEVPTLYNIYIAEDIATDVTTDPANQAAAGTEVTVTATCTEHFHVTRIKVYDKDEILIEVNDGKFTMPESYVTIYVEIEEDNKYFVTYLCNSIIDTWEEIYEGPIGELREPTWIIPEGFTFAGWSISMASTTAITETFNVTENTYLYAVFAREESTNVNGFVKVTEAPADWTGEYLLVYEKEENEDDLTGDVAWTGEEAINSFKYVTITNGIITNPNGAATLTIAPMSNPEDYSIKVNNSYIKGIEGYNGLAFDENPIANTISIDDNGNAIITSSVGNTIMRFNGTSNQLRFRFYQSTSTIQTPVQLYKKSIINTVKYYTRVYSDSPTIESTTEITDPSVIPSGATLTVYGLTNRNAANLVIDDGGQLVMYNSETDGPVLATVRKNITGYTDPEGNDGYYLIANPTANALGEEDEYDALEGCAQFDLYTFDPTEQLEWRNQVGTASRVPFTRTVGYLFAVPSGRTMSFRGSLLPAGKTKITLVRAEEGAGIDFPGFNLIGNPYACNAYPTDEGGNFMSYYKMNEDGNELELVENIEAVTPCEGFFVEAAENNQKIYLTTETPVTVPSLLNITVNQNRGNVIDRAIVNFDGRNNLHKFMMNPAHTNLSIAKGGETFAAISTEAEGELPVNFKAEKNGTYTITVNTENVEVNYLHLIDNLTGMDTDLLSTPSYTFDAKTSDYASRFKLVFCVKNDNEEMSQANNFAYINNGEIVISNEGRATLQVIDVMGRIISSEEINGECRISTEGLTAGLYILNLNGMTQKIVVR